MGAGLVSLAPGEPRLAKPARLVAGSQCPPPVAVAGPGERLAHDPWRRRGPQGTVDDDGHGGSPFVACRTLWGKSLDAGRVPVLGCVRISTLQPLGGEKVLNLLGAHPGVVILWGESVPRS